MGSRVCCIAFPSLPVGIAPAQIFIIDSIRNDVIRHIMDQRQENIPQTYQGMLYRM